jgi:hypothetical protein
VHLVVAVVLVVIVKTHHLVFQRVQIMQWKLVQAGRVDQLLATMVQRVYKVYSLHIHLLAVVEAAQVDHLQAQVAQADLVVAVVVTQQVDHLQPLVLVMKVDFLHQRETTQAQVQAVMVAVVAVHQL